MAASSETPLVSIPSPSLEGANSLCLASSLCAILRSNSHVAPGICACAFALSLSYTGHKQAGEADMPQWRVSRLCKSFVRIACRFILLMGGFLLFFIAFFTVHAVFKAGTL